MVEKKERRTPIDYYQPIGLIANLPAYELVMINFVGGPRDGLNRVSPLANCILRIDGTPQGFYGFDGKQFIWILDADFKKFSDELTN